MKLSWKYYKWEMTTEYIGTFQKESEHVLFIFLVNRSGRFNQQETLDSYDHFNHVKIHKICLWCIKQHLQVRIKESE